MWNDLAFSGRCDSDGIRRQTKGMQRAPPIQGSNPTELTDELHHKIFFALVFGIRLSSRSVVVRAECFRPMMISFNYRVKLRNLYVEAHGKILRTVYINEACSVLRVIGGLKGFL